MEEDAIRIGLSLDYFWSLNPKQYAKHVKIYQEMEEKRLKEKDTFNYVLGKYIAFAVNDPKHYPDKPFSEMETRMREMSDDEMEKQAIRNTIMMGGVIRCVKNLKIIHGRKTRKQVNISMNL